MDQFEELLIDFTGYVNRLSLSHNTVIAYTRDIKQFLEFIRSHYSSSNLDILTGLLPQDVRAWLVYRIKNVSKRSNNRALSSLRLLYKFLLCTYNIDNKALTSVKYAGVPKLLPKPTDADNIRKLLCSIDVNSWVGLRDKALIVLLYGCGLRISEALDIRDDQISSDMMFIKVIGKGNKERLIPVLPEVSDIIARYIAVRPITKIGFLFIGEHGGKLSRNYFARRLSQLSGNTIHAHMLRHSCASHLLNNGGSIRAIQQLLGHASLSSTQIYSEVSKTKMIEEYNIYHPEGEK